MKTLLTISLTAATLLLSAAPAFAQESRSLVVSYADLDLSTERGVRILDRRIRAAAVEACGPVSDADLEGKNDARLCRSEILSSVLAQRGAALAGVKQPRNFQIATRN